MERSKETRGKGESTWAKGKRRKTNRGKGEMVNRKRVK